jgi:O-succinylbenzoic acid--CoA ligase
LLARAAAGGWPVARSYGMTEASSQVATSAPSAALAEGELPPMPFVTIRSRSIDGTDLAPCAEGQIVVSGPIVSPGYWPPDASEETDGFATGDLGWLDERGGLHVVGRLHDVLITGGENVHPAEVEAVLDEHPRVLESCVVGVPDREWGQRLVAALVPRRTAGEAGGEANARAADDRDADVLAFLRARLAGYKVPRGLVWLAHALPRNSGGKVLRSKVLEELTDDPGR